MVIPKPNGTHGPGSEYHLYFQSTNPGQSAGSVWGHASSRDLVSNPNLDTCVVWGFRPLTRPALADWM